MGIYLSIYVYLFWVSSPDVLFQSDHQCVGIVCDTLTPPQQTSNLDWNGFQVIKTGKGNRRQNGANVHHVLDIDDIKLVLPRLSKTLTPHHQDLQ